METVIRSSALVLFASCVCLLIKKSNPEAALLLSVAAAVAVIASAVRTGSAIGDMLLTGRNLTDRAGVYLSPMLKCTGIGILTSVTAALCRDSSQGALASAMELAGTLAALAVSVPTLISLLDMIGAMV